MSSGQPSRKRRREVLGFQPSASLREKLLKLAGYSAYKKKNSSSVPTPTNVQTPKPVGDVLTPSHGNSRSLPTPTSRLSYLSQTERDALRSEAIKYKHAADGSKSDLNKMHILYLKAGIKFYEHAVAGGNLNRKTPPIPTQSLLELCEFLSTCQKLAQSQRREMNQTYVVLYLKLRSMANQRRFTINASKIGKIREIVSSKRRTNRELNTDMLQSVDYLVSELKFPTRAVLLMSESENLRTRVIAEQSAASPCMQLVPQMSAYASPDAEEQNLALMLDCLNKLEERLKR